MKRDQREKKRIREDFSRHPRRDSSFLADFAGVFFAGAYSDEGDASMTALDWTMTMMMMMMEKKTRPAFFVLL